MYVCVCMCAFTAGTVLVKHKALRYVSVDLPPVSCRAGEDGGRAGQRERDGGKAGTLIVLWPLSQKEKDCMQVKLGVGVFMTPQLFVGPQSQQQTDRHVKRQRDSVSQSPSSSEITLQER